MANGVLIVSEGVDWSAVAVDYVQSFFPTFDGALYALYLHGTGHPLAKGRDYSGNGRNLNALGAPSAHVGYETMSYLLGGYSTPFTEAQLAAGGAFTVLSVAKVAKSNSATLINSGNGDPVANSNLYVESAADVRFQNRISSTVAANAQIPTNADLRGGSFMFLGGAADANNVYAYRRLPGGIGTSKTSATKSTAGAPASERFFGIGRTSPSATQDGGYATSSDIAASAFFSRLLTDAEVDAACAALRVYLAGLSTPIVI